MKKILTTFSLTTLMLLPFLVKAHGGVDDGDEDVATPHPEQRMIVLGAVVIIALLLAGFMWYAHVKNKPVPTQKSDDDVTPQ